MTSVTRRIFVVGSGRSGTTLLQGFLAAHDQVLAFTESHLFDKGFRRQLFRGRWKVLPALKVRVSSFFSVNAVSSCCDEKKLQEKLSGDAATAAAALIDFFDRCAESQNKTAWLEKTPNNVRRISLLTSAAENAVFIHILRRPVETILSLRKAKAQWGGKDSWLRCFAHWYIAMWCSGRCTSLPNHYFVTYEDLTENPKTVLQTLIEQVGLSWDDAIIERRIKATESLVRTNEVWKANNFGEIQARPAVPDNVLPWWLRHLLRHLPIYEKLRQVARDALPESHHPPVPAILESMVDV